MQIKDLLPWGRKPARADLEAGTGAGAGAGTHPLAGLQRELNRVFDSFWSRMDHPVPGSAPGNAPGNALGSSLRIGAPALPRADVAETDAAILVSVELPGMDEKDIEVSLSGEVLTLRGEKKAEREEDHKGLYLSERIYGAFYRAIPIPGQVDADKVAAQFRNGVLTITLPRTGEARADARRIEVKAA